eukprot:2075671-Rhodomonas_salina.2
MCDVRYRQDMLVPDWFDFSWMSAALKGGQSTIHPHVSSRSSGWRVRTYKYAMYWHVLHSWYTKLLSSPSGFASRSQDEALGSLHQGFEPHLSSSAFENPPSSVYSPLPPVPHPPSTKLFPPPQT